jgi:hypothetical protein
MILSIPPSFKEKKSNSKKSKTSNNNSKYSPASQSFFMMLVISKRNLKTLRERRVSGDLKRNRNRISQIRGSFKNQGRISI